jgi:hypothetical protein
MRTFACFAARVFAYFVAAVAAFVVAFSLGAEHYDNAHCDDPGSVDCDLGIGEGAVWGFAAILLVAVAAIAFEVRIWIRRRRGSN